MRPAPERPDRRFAMALKGVLRPGYIQIRVLV